MTGTPVAPPPAEPPGPAQLRQERLLRPPIGGDQPAPAASGRPPDVHISIGRVEVHAAPARPAPGHPAAPRRPQQSLADYLARRK